MKLEIYSIYDVAVEAYSQPFFAATDAAATRLFLRLQADTESLVALNPGDFALRRLGTFDDQDGSLTPTAQPVHILYGAPQRPTTMHTGDSHD